MSLKDNDIDDFDSFVDEYDGKCERLKQDIVGKKLDEIHAIIERWQYQFHPIIYCKSNEIPKFPTYRPERLLVIYDNDDKVILRNE